jgi:hypothetical protein
MQWLLGGVQQPLLPIAAPKAYSLNIGGASVFGVASPDALRPATSWCRCLGTLISVRLRQFSDPKVEHLCVAATPIAHIDYQTGSHMSEPNEQRIELRALPNLLLVLVDHGTKGSCATWVL